MNSLLNFLTGKKTAWVTLLIGLVFAGLAFGPLSVESTDTTPGDGLPETAESMVVAKLQEDLPKAEGSAVFIVYASQTELSESQLEWLQGTFDPMT